MAQYKNLGPDAEKHLCICLSVRRSFAVARGSPDDVIGIAHELDGKHVLDDVLGSGFYCN